MRYVDQIRLDADAGIKAVHNFRANSIFDPDETAGGHQPLGHDEWGLFYNHYIVLGAKITCQFNATTSFADASIYGIYLADDTVLPIKASTICEQGLARWNSAPLSTDGGTSSKRIYNTYSAKKFHNVKDVADNSGILGASFGNNPAENAIFTVFTQALNSLANPPVLDVLVTIEYIVMMQEPKSLNPS